MGTKLNKSGFQQLIDENIAWLDKQPRSLERDHIRLVLEQCVGVYYPPVDIEAAQKLMVDYLVPDGISKDEFISGIILILDPPQPTEVLSDGHE